MNKSKAELPVRSKPLVRPSEKYVFLTARTRRGKGPLARRAYDLVAQQRLTDSTPLTAKGAANLEHLLYGTAAMEALARSLDYHAAALCASYLLLS